MHEEYHVYIAQEYSEKWSAAPDECQFVNVRFSNVFVFMYRHILYCFQSNPEHYELFAVLKSVLYIIFFEKRRKKNTFETFKSNACECL